MKYVLARIVCDQIVDWETFHDVFVDAFGFPDFYGRNLNAWIDCLTSIDAPIDGMTSIHAPDDGCVVIQLDKVIGLKRRCRDIYSELLEGIAFVNWRRLELGDVPVLMLSFHG